MNFVTIALSTPATLATVVLAVMPVALAIALVSRASRRQPARPAAAPADLTDIRDELTANYASLRRSDIAVPLTTNAWNRFRARAESMPISLRKEVAQAYHAIDVSNHLLAAAADYDAYGNSSARSRGRNLWPTLEAAVRAALGSLDAHVAPAVPVHASYVPPAEGAVRPATAEQAAEARRLAHAAVANVAEPAVKTFDIARAPRLTVAFAGDRPRAPRPSPATFQLVPFDGRPHSAESPARPQRPARPVRRRAAVRAQQLLEGQMGLWESVA